MVFSSVLFLLFSQTTLPRQVINFNFGWQKALLSQAQLAPSDQFTPKLAQLTDSQTSQIFESELKPNQLSFVSVNLPDTAHIEPAEVDKPWQGICYYKKNFFVPKQWQGKRVVLTFNGAMQAANLEIDHQLVADHFGGYLPFVTDISSHLHFGAENSVVVRLDNRDNSFIPPGKPTPDLDFLYYGGLYRDSFLTVENPVHFTNPFISQTPRSGGIVFDCLSTSQGLAEAKVSAEVANDSKHSVRVSVVFHLGSESVKTTSALLGPNSKQTLSALIKVKNPHLWSPAHPNLYKLTAILNTTQPTDEESLTVGLRRLVFSREKGLLVNGIPTRLIGTNRHMEYPFIGNALSDNASYRDMKEIKEAGFNCVRLAHYPQDPAVMDACDRLGIFAIVCAPGWQYYNSNPIFEQRVERDIKQMVRWHRNHPSVLAWESALNETYPRKQVAEKWYKAAHSEFTESDMTTVSDYTDGFSWDWPYNQWDDQTASRPQNAPGKPGYIREYGDWEFGGAESTSRQPMTSAEKGQLQEAWNFAWCHNRDRGQWPWTMGDGTWVMYDYHRGYDPTTEHSGMADEFRIPRYIYQFFQSQYSPKPFVFIANQWTPRQSPTKVVVFSNGDRVKLFLNGQLVGDQAPDHGPDTPYGNYAGGGDPWSGGNANHLPHPPFTFMSVPFQAGTLKAVAYRNGKEIARQVIHTPGAPAKLKIAINCQGIPLAADGADTIFVYVKLLDAKGNPVYTNGRTVTVSVVGAAHLVGRKVAKTENGIASFMIQSTRENGSIVIVATSSGLKGTSSGVGR